MTVSPTDIAAGRPPGTRSPGHGHDDATRNPHPILLAGRWVDSPDPLVVANPADPANPAGATYHATEAQYEEAVEAAVAAFEETRQLPAYERGRILRAISAGIAARREELGRAHLRARPASRSGTRWSRSTGRS